MESLVDIANRLAGNAQWPILAIGLLLAFGFVVLGLLIGKGRRYNLIAGYNRAPAPVKAEYDIAGLARHVGNGLITLGAQIGLSACFFFWEIMIGFALFFGLALLTTLMILIGSRRYMPAYRRLAAASPPDAKHWFLHRTLPTKWYRAIEKGTRQWEQVCRTCGQVQDFWEAGGVRYKAAGEPIKLSYCEACGRGRMHKIRRKQSSRVAPPLL